MPLLDVVLALIVIGIVGWLVNTLLAVDASIKSILNIVMALLVVGMVLWLINSYVPMAGGIKAILNIVVVAATCVGVLKAVGLWDEVVRLGSFWRMRSAKAHIHVPETEPAKTSANAASEPVPTRGDA
jgi:predicted membrane protein